MIFVNRLINRAINYAVTPVLSRALAAADSAWDSLTPETRVQLLRTVTWIVLPLLYIIDALRAGIVKAYVLDGRHALGVWQQSLALTQLAFRAPKGDELDPARTVARVGSGGRSGTRTAVLPLLLVGAPLFYIADILRSWVIDVARPEYRLAGHKHVEDIWQTMFGAATRNEGRPGDAKRVE